MAIVGEFALIPCVAIYVIWFDIRVKAIRDQYTASATVVALLYTVKLENFTCG